MEESGFLTARLTGGAVWGGVHLDIRGRGRPVVQVDGQNGVVSEAGHAQSQAPVTLCWAGCRAVGGGVAEWDPLGA